jgi:hypothetical protein
MYSTEGSRALIEAPLCARDRAATNDKGEHAKEVKGMRFEGEM